MAVPEISWEFTVVLIHHHTMRPFEKYSAKLPTNKQTMRKLQQYANGKRRAGNEQPRWLAPISVSRDGRPGSGGWHPENWSWPTFSSFSSSFWSSLSCSVGGWQKLSSSWKQVEVAICVLILFNWLIGNSNKYQIQNQYQIDYQTKILRKQLTVVSPVDDTGDLNLLGEVKIWIHRHQGHHHHHHHQHNCRYHYKSDPQTSQLCIAAGRRISIISSHERWKLPHHQQLFVNEQL